MKNQRENDFAAALVFVVMAAFFSFGLTPDVLQSHIYLPALYVAQVATLLVGFWAIGYLMWEPLPGTPPNTTKRSGEEPS